jgi:hypothetical protein
MLSAASTIAVGPQGQSISVKRMVAKRALVQRIRGMLLFDRIGRRSLTGFGLEHTPEKIRRDEKVRPKEKHSREGVSSW